MMEISEFMAREKEVKNLYFIAAENSYLRAEFKERFLEKFVPVASRDFNLSLVKPGDNYLKRLKSAINTPPMGAASRFIISEINLTDELNKNELADLTELISKIASDSILVFISETTPDKRRKFYQLIKKSGCYQEFKTPRYRDLDQWIKKQFNQAGKKLDQQSLKVLENMFSNRLEILASEIEKIITCYPEKDFLNYQDLKKIISREKFIEDEEIFTFLDLIGEKKTDKALLSLKEMLGKGVYPLYLLTMLKNQVELLMQVKYYSNFTHDNKKIAKELNKHPYPVKKALQRSKNFTQFELEKLLAEILKANYNFLTGYYPEQNMALEMIILKAISY